MNKVKKIIKKITPKILIKCYHFCLAYLGALIYDFPSKKIVIIGVAGTRGKTTTANFIWSCLNAANHKVGLVSTANIRIAEKEMLNPYHMTMPGRFILQKLLSKMHKMGCQYAIIETPSEGIEQCRHRGIYYDIAVFTTLYPEYLEAHNWDFERCKRMNLKIFTTLSRQKRKIINGKEVPKVMIINNDSPDKDLFLQFNADKKLTYAVSLPADFMAKDIYSDFNSVKFSVSTTEYKLNILGDFNVYNALAAIATVSALGIDKEFIKKGLADLNKVPGRMEKIEDKQLFSVFVDYAHDAVAMEKLLKSAKEMKKDKVNKIILLLGAEGGGRDIKKRPIMGEIAAKEADYIVISNVDPYDDDPYQIMEDIAKGARKHGKIENKDLFLIEDRRKGISKAISLAQAGDIVLITGKGAEQSMIIGSKKILWDDRKIVKEELKKIFN